MPDAHARIDSLKVDIQVIGDMVLDLQAKVVGHDRRFDQLDARLDTINARLITQDARFDAHDARFDAHDMRFDAHDMRFDAIDAQLTEILKRLPQRPHSRD